MPREERGPRRGDKLGGESRMAATDTTNCAARAERAQELLHRAVSWRRSHPDAWMGIVEAMLHEVDAKRRAPIKWAVEEIRKRDYASFPTPYPSVSNSLCPAFARMVSAEYPRADEYVEKRPSCLDEIAVDWSSTCL